MYQKKISRVVMGVFLVSIFGSCLPLVHAAQPGAVVINEVAWAGSADSANDEWIELYNPTSVAVDLSGWVINDDHGASLYSLSGTIASHGYYVIEDAETVVQPLVASAIINVSLANSGDSLTLLDAQSAVIDDVNSSGGAWFAGNGTTHATMERVDALASGDVASNWATSTGTGFGNTSSGGSAIHGTPGGINSVSGSGPSNPPPPPPPPTGTSSVTISSASSPIAVGSSIDVTVNVNNVQNLFDYGTDIIYDSQILQFRSVSVGNFLSANNTVTTSFQTGLENGQPGKLVVAEARTMATKQGVSGTGTLFTMHFDVVSESANSVISFGSGSFLADPNSDIAVTFPSYQFAVQPTAVASVMGLQAVGGTDRYTIALSWQSVNGADSYKVLRQNSHGTWTTLGQTMQPQFLDSDSIVSGGKIIPQHQYLYRVVAAKGALESDPSETQGTEVRGLKGDNNRSDRTDGRDLERLAQHFTEDDSVQNFDALIDTTYDGQVDGSDLIDIGLSFGKTYP